MAPKGRGGGGGSRGSRGSGSRCDSDAFASEYSRIYIAFYGIWLVINIGIAFLIDRRKKRILSTGYPKETLQWSMVSLSMTVTIIAQILVIASAVLSECGTGIHAAVDLLLASSWLNTIGQLLLWGIILVPVCRQLHQLAGQIMAKAVTIVNFCLMVLLSILLLSALSITTAISGSGSSSSYLSLLRLRDLQEAQRGLLITYDVFVLIGMLTMTGLVSLAASRSPNLRSGNMAIWIPLLTASSVGMATFELGNDAYVLFNRRRYTGARDLAVLFIGQFFYAFVFVCVLYIISNSALSTTHPDAPAPAVGPTDPAAGTAPPAPGSPQKDYYAPSPMQQPVPPYPQQPQYQQQYQQPYQQPYPAPQQPQQPQMYPPPQPHMQQQQYQHPPYPTPPPQQPYPTQ